MLIIHLKKKKDAKNTSRKMLCLTQSLLEEKHISKTDSWEEARQGWMYRLGADSNIFATIIGSWEPPWGKKVIPPNLEIFICCYCSVVKSCPTLCDHMDCSTPGFPVFHCLLEFAQTHVHCISDAIQPSHLLWSPSILAFNLPQYQGLFQRVSSSHQVAKVLELQL